MVKTASFFILFLFCLSSIAGTIDPYVDDSKYIAYGEKFFYIGEILVNRKDTDAIYAGSVVAIDNKVVLTAAHILHEYKQAKIVINKKILNVTKSVVYDDYHYNTFGKHDIAVCFLDIDIGLDWYPDLYSDADESGKICALSGYGSTGDFFTGIIKSGNGTKRAGSNKIDSTDDFALFCSPSFIHNRTSLEFLIAVGDSGGGLFIDNRLAGIHSGIIEGKTNRGKSKYGAVSVHTRISKYKDWIQKIVSEIKDTTKNE